MNDDALLTVEAISVFYGSIQALKGISLNVKAGEMVTLIGANGAGKTTTLATIAGLHKPAAGAITFGGQDVTGWPAHRLVRDGLALCPEGRRIFANLTVDENLDLGAYVRRDDQVQRDLHRVKTLFPVLADRARQRAGTLSGGEQQMLSIARALMSRPRLLMLDEPSLGLAPKLVEQVFQALRELKHQHVTILLVEQDAFLALETADRAYVLETGKVVKSGPAHELARDPAIRSAYLGG
jgi:branched-chain amino acid transport system ATP-binding protein